MPYNSESFFDYIGKRGIEQLKSFSILYKKNYEIKSQGEVLRQLSTISVFHKRAMGYDGYIVEKLNNNIGKIFENYKVDITRFKRDLKILDEVGANDINEVGKIFKEYGYKYLERAESVINLIEESEYNNLILRSMRRNEISLYNCGGENLRSSYILVKPSELNMELHYSEYLYKYFKGEQYEFLEKEEKSLHNTLEVIQVVNIDRCAYNLVEVDCYYLLNFLRKKKYEYDYKFLVSAFCYFEKLDRNSEKFILALLSYPTDFMRWVQRYRENRKDWTAEKYAEKFKKIIEKDNDSLI